MKRRLVPRLATMLVLGGCTAPPLAFDRTTPPPPPDYSTSEAWLALPDRDGLERSTPVGLAPVSEAEALADVFFIHPTTIAAKDVWNATWDASDAAAPLNPAVLLGQASAFNACCRIYAPRYRQATLPALSKSQAAVDLAYEDIAAAFRQFVAQRNQGRPFILASHSQGTLHAIRLLQTEILDTPQQARMVAAYLIGGYAPEAFREIGLPICDAADQTGCVLSWNAAKPGNPLARLVIDGKTYWWRGELKSEDQPPAICVNPLTWRAQTGTDDAAPPSLNTGTMPLPRAPFPEASSVLPALAPGLTGARCRNGLLEVDLSRDTPATYGDPLTRWAGSYHLNDYGLFYRSLRENAVTRVTAWGARNPER